MALRTVAPSELAPTASGSPRRLRLQPERISAYASRPGPRHNLRQMGPDFEIDSFRPLSALDQAGREDRHPLTYLSSRKFASPLEGRSGLTVVTTPDLQACVPPENGVLLTSESPRDVFHSIMNAALGLGLFECLETFISTTARISPTAVISPNVYVSDHAEIGPGVVILPNTYVGPGVVIKPNAVIGGNGFEPVSGRREGSDNARRVVAHAGGVWLAEGVHVGSCNCVDKGLFGDFTELGSYTLLDNLVQFAHSSRAGRGCSITPCVEISGSVVLGDGVWLGPNSSINQGIHIAEHCYIGTGSVVVRDLRAYSLAYGSPAKFSAWVCECRAKLRFEPVSSTASSMDDARSVCEVCGKQYLLTDGTVRPA